MDTYIVRQPIVDKSRNVVAYEILYKEDVNSLYMRDDEGASVASAIEQFLTNMDGETFLDGKTAFFTFTSNLLMKNIPKMFPADKMVIQIDDATIIHPVAQKIIYRFKKEGYRVAVQGFTFSPRYFGILDVVDIIKVDFSDDTGSLENITRVAHSFSKEVAAYNVNSAEALEHAKALDCDYYQGSYVAEQKTQKVRRTDHMQSNFFQLMIAVTKDEPDTTEIADIISRDVTLAFSLLKLVNSAYFARRNRVKSVQQALVILGIGQLKQWIYLLSFKQDGGGVQDELIKLSFQRGRFCEDLMQYAHGVPLSRNEAYMMGMFSTLGTLMEAPIESALAELPIVDEIKTALTTGEGPAGDLFNVVLCYENADWAGMSVSAQNLGLPPDVISRTYFECIEYVNEIWEQLQTPGQAQ
ncbi:MAG: HDOD domain-containing protein [Subdoligranulum sp.]|nr:HDOD domain-containing protein [Subdoligranulum sp.]